MNRFPARQIPRVLLRQLFLALRHRRYREFLRRIKPVGIGSMRLAADPSREPRYAEYERLLRLHPRYRDLGDRAFARALRFLLKYDKFMRAPGVYTMCARTQMWNVVHCAEDALARGVPGDLLEAGSWRGGMGMLLKEILRRNGDATRAVWLADAWTGRFPDSATETDAEVEDLLNRLFDAGPTRDEVVESFRAMNLLDSRVHFVQGYFADTLPTLKVERLAVLRLDADLYNSTRDALTHLYPKLSPGGYVIIDDYGIAACDCRKAVDEYRAAERITSRVHMADLQCAYWRK